MTEQNPMLSLNLDIPEPTAEPVQSIQEPIAAPAVFAAAVCIADAFAPTR